jgi:hypothetical protein
LDSVRESERAKEEAIRQETLKQLERFRQQQEAANQANRTEDTGGDVSPTGGQSSPPPDRQWAVSGKKRRRGHDKEVLLKGVKVRKHSTSEADPKLPLRDDGPEAKTLESSPVDPSVSLFNEPEKSSTSNDAAKGASSLAQSSATKSANPAALGLGAYGSDSD